MRWLSAVLILDVLTVAQLLAIREIVRDPAVDLLLAGCALCGGVAALLSRSWPFGTHFAEGVETVKSAFKSKTILGALVAILSAVVLRLAHIGMLGELPSWASDGLWALLLAGLGGVVWGRSVASGPVTWRRPGSREGSGREGGGNGGPPPPPLDMP